jgi:integrase
VLYKRGNIWWYEFSLDGCRIRESTKLASKTAAKQVERHRHTELRTRHAGIKERKRVPMFSIAAEQYLAAKKNDWSSKTYVIEETNFAHLKKCFASCLLTDINAIDVGKYRDGRRNAGASLKTITLEIGTLRALLRFHDFDATWIAIRKKIKLAKAEKIARCVTFHEQTALLDECRKSRSRSLYVAVVIALEACLRYSEIRMLRWRQVDFHRQVVTVSDSKTDAGRGREVPMTQFLTQTLFTWASAFPDRKLDHFVFPLERYGGKGHGEAFGFSGSVVYSTNPTQPIGSWKEAWESARKRAGVSCRFHDLRHTGCTQLLDAGVSHPIVAEIMGWSTSTAIRMIKEVYGHISLAARQMAIEQRERFTAAVNSPQNPPQSDKGEKMVVQ